MFNVKEALEWSRKVLKKGGYIFIEDYSGPSYFQYNDETLEFAREIRRALPRKYLINPYVYHNASLFKKFMYKIYLLFNIEPLNKNDFIRTEINRPSKEVIINTDPSETGGSVYNFALNDIIYNFKEKNKKDMQLLSLLLRIDDLARSSEEINNHYIFAVGNKT